MNIKYFNFLIGSFIIYIAAFPTLTYADDLQDLAKTAFLENEKITYEIEQLWSSGWEAGDFYFVPVSSLCGVAGCDSTTLVSYLFSQKNSTPRSKSVMATVQIRQPGSIVLAVKRVSLEAGRVITLQPRPGSQIPAGRRPVLNLQATPLEKAPYPKLQIESVLPIKPSQHMNR